MVVIDLRNQVHSGRAARARRSPRTLARVPCVTVRGRPGAHKQPGDAATGSVRANVRADDCTFICSLQVKPQSGRKSDASGPRRPALGRMTLLQTRMAARASLVGPRRRLHGRNQCEFSHSLGGTPALRLPVAPHQLQALPGSGERAAACPRLPSQGRCAPDRGRGPPVSPCARRFHSALPFSSAMPQYFPLISVQPPELSQAGT